MRFFAVLLCLLIVGWQSPVFAQSSASAPEDPWEVAGKPGAAHEKLKALVGNWDATIKSWSQPNTTPRESKARATKEWFLGSRFVKEDFEGLGDGGSFKGFGLLGFENVAGRYTSTWADTTSTSILSSAGQFDGSGSTLILLGEYLDPASRQVRKTRSVYRIVSPELHIFEMYELLGRREDLKTLEIVYNRR